MGGLTGGRAVVELLKAEQVRYVFGIVGATFLDVLDALYDDRSVEYINVRHEQAAAFMADGLARVTGLPGVCLVTSGPGATNLLTGVAAAYVAHSPVVVLVGGVSLELAIHGDGGFLMNAQELETAVRHGINVVTVVMNNNCWGSEKAYQKHFYGGRYIGCDIGNPRYDQYARLFGAEGYYVDHPDQVGDAVRAALSSGKPAVVEIPIDPEEFPTPVAAVRRDKAGSQGP